MFEPKRLLEGDGLAGQLLRSGVDEMPSRRAMRRTTLAVAGTAVLATSTIEASGAAAAGASGAASIGKASVAPWSFLLAAKWVAVGMLGGAVALTAATQLVGAPSSRPIERTAAPAVPHSTKNESLRENPPSAIFPLATNEAAGSPRDEPASPTVHRDGHGSDGRASPSPDSLPTVETHRGAAGEVERTAVDDALSVTAHPAPTQGRAGPTPPVPGTPSGSSSDNEPGPLAGEIAFVDRGWNDLKAGGYERALADLAGYERTFVDLRLHPEVLFLRMEAETHLGRTAIATDIARHLVSVYPKSAQAGRAREILRHGGVE